MTVRHCLVTTSLKADEASWQLARELADALDQEPRRRRGKTLVRMCQEADAQGALVCSAEQVVWWCPSGQFAFHPGMASLRVKGLRRGERDRLVAAMALQPGDSVLDCTLGLGADASVCSFVVGDRGQVVGLESTALLAVMVAHGLRHCRVPDAQLQLAMRRLVVLPEDYSSYLSQLPLNAFDVVYFDPMFRQGLSGASSLRLLEPFLNRRPLDLLSLQEARRVARKRVVFKEQRGSPEFSRLGFPKVLEDTSGRIAYGISWPQEV